MSVLGRLLPPLKLAADGFDQMIAAGAPREARIGAWTCRAMQAIIADAQPGSTLLEDLLLAALLRRIEQLHAELADVWLQRAAAAGLTTGQR